MSNSATSQTGFPASFGTVSFFYCLETHPALARLFKAFEGHTVTLVETNVKPDGSATSRARTTVVGEVMAGQTWIMFESWTFTVRRTFRQPHICLTPSSLTITTIGDLTQIRTVALPSGLTALATFVSELGPAGATTSTRGKERGLPAAKSSSAAGRMRPNGPGPQLIQRYSEVRNKLRRDKVADPRIEAILAQVKQGKLDAPELAAHTNLVSEIRNLQSRLADETGIASESQKQPTVHDLGRPTDIDQTSSTEFWALRLRTPQGISNVLKVLIEHPGCGNVGRIVEASILGPIEDGFDPARYLVGQAVVLYTVPGKPVVNFDQLARLQKQPLFWSLATPAIALAGYVSAIAWWPTRPSGDYLPGLWHE